MFSSFLKKITFCSYIARTLNRCIRWEADSYQMKGLMIIIERNIPDVASEILNYGWKEVLRGNKFHLAYRCNTLYLRGRFDCPARSEKERYRLDSRGDWLRLNIESDEEFVGLINCLIFLKICEKRARKI